MAEWRSRMAARDLFAEAMAGLLQRPARSVLTMLGTVLGIGAFVAILGLTATASSQIDTRFTALAATEVTVTDVGDEVGGDFSYSFPDDAAARVAGLNGVVQAGVLFQVPVRRPVIAAAPGIGDGSEGPAFWAAETSALAAMHPQLSAGRLFDGFHAERAEPVAVLGRIAADRLGIMRLDGQPAVFVNGTPFTVVGIVDDVRRRSDLLTAVVIPTRTALHLYGPPLETRAEMIIETRVGAAEQVAGEVALALRPDAPQRFRADAPPDPQSLRGGVSSDLAALFLLLAAISVTIGAVGIANTTLVAVLERTNEIGIRRALGARGVHIATQFLTESTVLGLFGGLIGSSLGVMTVVITALSQRWSAVLEPWVVAAAPGVGALVGLVAGAYPAWRAARVEPVDALRR